MTEYERQSLCEAITKNAPDWYKRLKKRLEQKRNLIITCMDIASRSDSSYNQDEVNRIYNACCSMMNETETHMLNYICLIKHREQLNDGIRKEDEDIQRWIKYLQEFRDSDSAVICLLDQQAQKLINQSRVKKAVGRPNGTGKQVFSYNGKEYHTIQECADEYGISKQGMHKRLKKLNII